MIGEFVTNSLQISHLVEIKFIVVVIFTAIALNKFLLIG